MPIVPWAKALGFLDTAMLMSKYTSLAQVFLCSLQSKVTGRLSTTAQKRAKVQRVPEWGAC